MTPNATQYLQDYISKNLILQRGLQKSLLNVRALARCIKKEHGLETSVETITRAIRKFPYEKQKESNISEHYIVATKNNMVGITLKKELDVKTLTKIMKIVNSEKEETLRIIKGEENSKIITGTQHLKKIKKILKKEHVEDEEKLSEIKINTENQVKSIIAKVSNELTLNNINVNEILFCGSEIIVYVNQEDLLKAHNSIVQLCQRR